MIALALLLAPLVQASQFVNGVPGRCAGNETACESTRYCFDETCDGIGIESAEFGQCRCVNGFFRSRKTRECRPKPLNCIDSGASRQPPPTLPPAQPLRAQPIPDTFCPQPPPCPACDSADHLLTVNPKETDEALKVLSYEFEGQVGRIATSQAALPSECSSGLVMLHRFHKYPESDHVYTTKEVDMEIAKKALGYVDEGSLGWCMREADSCGATLPLYRLYNFVHINHFYTTKESVALDLRGNQQWVYEGIECYLWP